MGFARCRSCSSAWPRPGLEMIAGGGLVVHGVGTPPPPAPRRAKRAWVVFRCLRPHLVLIDGPCILIICSIAEDIEVESGWSRPAVCRNFTYSMELVSALSCVSRTLYAWYKVRVLDSGRCAASLAIFFRSAGSDARMSNSFERGSTTASHRRSNNTQYVVEATSTSTVDLAPLVAL